MLFLQRHPCTPAPVLDTDKDALQTVILCLGNWKCASLKLNKKLWPFMESRELFAHNLLIVTLLGWWLGGSGMSLA